jgi:hypothetical protein
MKKGSFCHPLRSINTDRNLMKAYDTERVLHWDKPTMESTFHAPAGQNIQQFAPSGADCFT